jgi:hypothetical protein
MADYLTHRSGWIARESLDELTMTSAGDFLIARLEVMHETTRCRRPRRRRSCRSACYRAGRAAARAGRALLLLRLHARLAVVGPQVPACWPILQAQQEQRVPPLRVPLPVERTSPALVERGSGRRPSPGALLGGVAGSALTLLVGLVRLPATAGRAINSRAIGATRRHNAVRARQDSNLRLPAPEADALSTELRARDHKGMPSEPGARDEHMFVRAGRYRGTVDTIARGNAAEAAVLHALTSAGLAVFVPFGGGSPFDLVALVPDGRLLRLQVKAGWIRNGCVEFNSRSTDHGHGQRSYRGRADLFAVHLVSPERVYVVPVDDCPTSRGCLRLDPPRNSQRRRVRFAEDYAFETWLRSVRATLVA